MSEASDTSVRIKPLHHIFTRIPAHYDLINHVITFGMDAGWREKAAQACLDGTPTRILDLCCGTGDFAVTLARLAGYEPEIIGVDYSQPMLAVAGRKLKSITRKNISFIHADAAKLPFEDNHFDCVGISFAFRNLTYKNPMRSNYMKEIFRVLKPGGRFVIVESSQPSHAFIRFCDHLYLRIWVFTAGYLLSGNREAYRYLVESTLNFFSVEEMKSFLLKSGFANVTWRKLFFGAAAIYTAVK